MQRFRPYLSYLKAVRWSIIGALLCGIVYGVANGAGLPYMVKKVLPKIFAPDAVRLTDLQLFLLALWLPAVFLVRGLAGYFNSYLIQYAGTHILEALRLDYFRKLQVLPIAFLQKQKTGDLISRGMTDTQSLQISLTTFANDIFKQPTTLIGALGYLGYLAYHERGVLLVLVCMAVVPLSVLPIRYVGKKLISRARKVQGQLGEVSERFSENLNAAREVRAFGLEEHEIRRLGRLTHALVTSQMKVTKYAQALSPSIEIISAFGISATLIYAYHIRLPWDSFFTIIMALFGCYEPIKKLGALQNITKIGAASLDRLEVVLNAPVTIRDPAHPVPVGRLQGHLSFEEVGLTYDNEKTALRSVSVTIPAGTTCALVGHSGAGKSTFANLVPRFYDVTAGRITIDGLDIRSLRLKELRDNIAIVSQEAILFNDTVFNNLMLGRKGATREEVEQAARDAFAHDFIQSLPQGYDTMVGERGATLSGGQRQRIAVARAFLRNAPILILDEATSALDSESEASIQQALKKLVVGKTVLIIAHRFSTIRDASMILVFEDAQIIAQGNHAELYRDNSVYRKLYDQQNHTGAQAETLI